MNHSMIVKNKVAMLMVEKFMAFIKRYHLEFEEGEFVFKK